MTAPRRHRRLAGQTGLTLIELMVSVLLASILVGGLFYMMSGQQTTYSQQMAATQTNQSLWGTMTYLQRWLRSAGYGFGSCPRFNATPPAAAHMKNSSNDNVVPSGVVGLRIYNHCNLLVTAPASCPDGSPADSFSVTAVHPARLATPSQPSAIIAAPMPLASSPLRVPNNPLFPTQFADGDLALLWDPAGGPCILLEVTLADKTTDPATLQHSDKEPYNNAGWNWVGFKPGGGFGEATRVTRLAPESHPRHFAVDPVKRQLVTWTTLDVNPSANKANLEVVADQIEDMQLSWACDGDLSGDLREGAISGQRVGDEWAFNVASDTLPACNDEPISAVRVTLIGRSNSEVPGATAAKIPAAEDETRSAAPFDRFARSVLTTTVETINMRVQ